MTLIRSFACWQVHVEDPHRSGVLAIQVVKIGRCASGRSVARAPAPKKVPSVLIFIGSPQTFKGVAKSGSVHESWL
eukprot:5200584-Amphidinium_carterae.1